MDSSFLLCLHAKNKKPPIYITIGPQCAGKTTFLSQLQQRISKDPTQQITDVTMDDQEGVYFPVDVQYFLEKFRGNARNNDRFLNRRVIGKTIGSRIAEQQEVSTVLQRLAGRLSRGEFESSIAKLYRDHAIDVLKRQSNNKNLTITDDMLQQDDHTRIAHHLMEAVEEFKSQEGQATTTLPKTVDLFCVEALFRPSYKTNMTGVDAAAHKLKKLAKRTSEALAWGNTNTRPREYKNALEAAANSGRQVYFVVYADSSRVSNGVFLPVLDFTELLRRNVNRLVEHGKYVPAKGMWESSQRVERFVSTVMRDLDRAVDASDDGGGDVLIPIHSKLEFDQKLAQMANFEMMEDRTVRFVDPKKKNRSTSRRKQTNLGGQAPPPSSSTTQLRA